MQSRAKPKSRTVTNTSALMSDRKPPEGIRVRTRTASPMPEPQTTVSHCGWPTLSESPPGRAEGSACQNASMPARLAASQPISASTAYPAPARSMIAIRKDAFTPTMTIRASAAKVPMRESFMMSSLRSAEEAPKKPSAVSPSPSSCSAPVIAASAPIASSAHARGGRFIPWAA